jgi:periplasmic divalent cation tolerance protein
MTEDVCEVVITAPDPAWLVAFSHQLVESHLCAGSHTVMQVRSVYRWQGQVEDQPEARVALHTRRSLVPEIVQLVNQEHPYDVPCVVAWPITDGNPAYLEWIIAETREPQPLAFESERS